MNGAPVDANPLQDFANETGALLLYSSVHYQDYDVRQSRAYPLAPPFRAHWQTGVSGYGHYPRMLMNLSQRTHAFMTRSMVTGYGSATLDEGTSRGIDVSLGGA